MTSQLIQNIVAGMRVGVLYAAFYCVAAALTLLGSPKQLDGTGLNVLQLFAIYAVSGIGIGGFVGGMRDHLTRRWHAYLVGVLATIPIFLALAIADGTISDRSQTIFLVTMLSLTLGGIGGVVTFGIWKS